MLKEFFGILLNNIYLVIPFMLYVSLHEISKIIAVFLIAFKDDISDEKAKAIARMMSHSMFTLHNK